MRLGWSLGDPQLTQKSDQCSPPQGPAQVAASEQAARSPGCEVLGLLQRPAGAVQWPLGASQGAGQLPCGGQYSHGPVTTKRGLVGTQTQAPGSLNPDPASSVSHIPPSPTPLCGPHPFHSLGISLSTSTAHRALMATCPLLLYLKSPGLISAHLRLSYLHIDEGPQVPPRQSQEQLNQCGVGSLYSQVQNGLIALDLLGEQQQRSGQSSVHTGSWQPSGMPYTDVCVTYYVGRT